MHTVRQVIYLTALYGQPRTMQRKFSDCAPENKSHSGHAQDKYTCVSAARESQAHDGVNLAYGVNAGPFARKFELSPELPYNIRMDDLRAICARCIERDRYRQSHCQSYPDLCTMIPVFRRFAG